MDMQIRQSRTSTVPVRDLKIEYYTIPTARDPHPKKPVKCVTFTILGAVHEWKMWLTYKHFRQLNRNITLKD